MSKKMKWLPLCIASIMIMTACSSSNSNVANPSSSPVPTTSETTPTPTSFQNHAPLTGIGIEQEAKERPIAVLINNLKPARPQSGLSEADVIWEVLAEGGITRLIALFQSTEDSDFDIGPIRSNRPYLIDIAESYGAVIVHAGASNDAYSILQKQKKDYLDEISNAGSYFWRSSDRKAPHNLYTNLTKLREGIEKKQYSSDVQIPTYLYEKESSASDENTSGDIRNIEIKFQMNSYKISYQYDEKTKQYLRFINDEPHNDRNNNEQLHASNIIALQTEHKVLDNEGRLSVDLQSGGKALLLQNGNKQQLEWIRATDGMIRFMNNGQEVLLTPGHTFIHVLPEGKSIEEHVTWLEKTNS